MRRQIFVAARQIAEDVRASENDFDLALAGNARLVARLLDARREAGLPARTGRTALDRALQAIAHGAQARASLLAMHDELADLNVRELAVGDLTECPEDWATGLSLVQPVSHQAA